MNGYLGETPLKTIGGEEAALIYIARYGGIDGDHHKTWVIDQVSRILLGTPVHVTLAKWENGTEEERYHTGEPSARYTAWVAKLMDGEDGPLTYSYDEGIAP